MLYFVRHGESTANLRRKFSNSGFQDPLTDKGVEQVCATARDMSGLAVARVYSSPVMRAVQTARILAECLHAPLEISEALREWSVGIYEGTSDPTGWALHRQVQDDWLILGNLDSRMPGGESYRDIQQRFIPFLQGLVCHGREQNQVLVGHGGLFLAMLPAVLRNVTPAFARHHGFSYGGYATVECRPEGLWCRSWCGEPLD